MSAPLGATGELGTVDGQGDQDEGRAQQIADRYRGRPHASMREWIALRQEYGFERAMRIFKRALWLWEQGA